MLVIGYKPIAIHWIQKASYIIEWNDLTRFACAREVDSDTVTTISIPCPNLNPVLPAINPDNGQLKPRLEHSSAAPQIQLQLWWININEERKRIYIWAMSERFNEFKILQNFPLQSPNIYLCDISLFFFLIGTHFLSRNSSDEGINKDTICPFICQYISWHQNIICRLILLTA